MRAGILPVTCASRAASARTCVAADGWFVSPQQAGTTLVWLTAGNSIDPCVYQLRLPGANGCHAPPPLPSAHTYVSPIQFMAHACMQGGGAQQCQHQRRCAAGSTGHHAGRRSASASSTRGPRLWFAAIGARHRRGQPAAGRRRPAGAGERRLALHCMRCGMEASVEAVPLSEMLHGSAMWQGLAAGQTCVDVQC